MAINVMRFCFMHQPVEIDDLDAFGGACVWRVIDEKNFFVYRIDCLAALEKLKYLCA